MKIIVNDVADLKGLTSIVGKELEATRHKLNNFTGYSVTSEELMTVGKPFRVKHVVEGKDSIMFDSSQVTVVHEDEELGIVEAYLAAEGEVVPVDKSEQYKRQRKYNEDNTVMKAIRLNKNTDADILDFLSTRHFQPVVKKALRKLMEEEMA